MEWKNSFKTVTVKKKKKKRKQCASIDSIDIKYVYNQKVHFSFKCSKKVKIFIKSKYLYSVIGKFFIVLKNCCRF